MICEARVQGIVLKNNSNMAKSGVPIVTLTIKNSRKYLNYKREISETSSWHTLHCIGEMIEPARKIKVGDFIEVNGHISHRKKEDGPLVNQFVYAIHATKLTVLG